MNSWAERALAAHRRKDYPAALDAYHQALQSDPDDVHAYNNFAVLLKDLGEYALAEKLLLEATRRRPEYAAAWSNLANVYRQQDRLPLALQCCERALALAPDNADSWVNQGNLLLQMLALEPALSSYRAALALNPNSAEVRWNLGLALLQAGRYREAWPYYEARSELASARYPFDRQRRWRGQPVAGPVLLWHEQGLGDTLQMLRAIPELRQRYPDIEFVLASPPSFQRLVHSSFPDLPWLDLREAPASTYAAQLPLMSVAMLLDWEVDTLPTSIPYLRVDAAALADWVDWLGSRRKPRVGLVWGTGANGVGHADRDRKRRSLSLQQLQPLLACDEVEWISLQLGEALADLADYPQIRDPSPQLRDWAATAALVQQLDLVISVDTAVAHLAGALGRPTWVLMKHDSGNFFPLVCKGTPWYPASRIFRQQQAGDWAGVVMHVTLQLKPIFTEHESCRK